jgi:hypothetical protein
MKDHGMGKQRERDLKILNISLWESAKNMSENNLLSIFNVCLL